MEDRRLGEEHHASGGGGEEDLWEDGNIEQLEEELSRDARKRYIMLACACLLGLGS